MTMSSSPSPGPIEAIGAGPDGAAAWEAGALPLAAACEAGAEAGAWLAGAAELGLGVAELEQAPAITATLAMTPSSDRVLMLLLPSRQPLTARLCCRCQIRRTALPCDASASIDEVARFWLVTTSWPPASRSTT